MKRAGDFVEAVCKDRICFDSGAGDGSIDLFFGAKFESLKLHSVVSILAFIKNSLEIGKSCESSHQQHSYSFFGRGQLVL